jgi:sugar phosphate isomerase/epimerase
MKRRKFLERSGIAAGAAILTDLGLQNKAIAQPSASKKSSKKTGNIKLGLYGITYLGIWYNGPGLSFEEFVQRAKEYGYEGVELDNKRPQGNPMDIDQKRRDEMRNVLAKTGMEIPAVACNNDFSSPIPEHRECQLLMVKETTRLARDLGAKIVRLFPAWTGIPLHEGIGTYDLVKSSFYTFEMQYPYSTKLDRWNFVKECLIESAGFGEEFGVTMALQNHPPLFKDYRDCLRMVKEVNSPWLKICLDAGMMDRKDPDWVEEAVRAVGPLQVHSHYGGEYFRNNEGVVESKYAADKYRDEIIEWADYDRYIELMGEINFNGYFCYELCHHVRTEDGKTAGLDYVHEQTMLAREYMSDILTRNSM